ncbi:hypothetical protein SAMN04487895_12735 [Paenibacillus sophorae]|uniref:Uncharacterized protein n=1 Tax=Paenibacillus sophorae TaxID=1333845 RepID=A0A1H8VSN9_9BACL|nr:hypothetical protein [Paenibacillus sophorae]QWU15687.1 hypothetical protein KP014_28390 [Paenibacillus sophorae]SEP18426.1 hypothetical protein SAMN04487895_12735 [Paenibacillus sophorae]
MFKKIITLMLFAFILVAPISAFADEAAPIESVNSFNEHIAPTPTDTTNNTPESIVTPQATDPFNLWFGTSSVGLEGNWSFNYPGKMVTLVSLTMDLQYRKNFLDSWETVDGAGFYYPGGLGSTEENQSTFYPTEAGQYRLHLTGNVSWIGGGTICTLYSGAKSYDGKIIIASPPTESK